MDQGRFFYLFSKRAEVCERDSIGLEGVGGKEMNEKYVDG